MKEFGSDFHQIDVITNNKNMFFETNTGLNLFFSGRVALYNLLQFGIKNHGWKKIGFPSYYCHEVMAFCKTLPAEIVMYPCGFFTDQLAWDDQDHTAIINVNYFGIHKMDMSALTKTTVIEDLTHDVLGISSSTADYVFGSIRKQLPTGVGGFCRVKKDEKLDEIPQTDLATNSFIKKKKAMQLKSQWLKNEIENNHDYLQYYKDSEEMFEDPHTNSVLPQESCQLLQKLPVSELVLQSQKNTALALALIKSNRICQVLNHHNGFMLMLYFENKVIRNQLRKQLIDHKIFPVILWPNQVLSQDKAFEGRVLGIHTDFRYSATEIEYMISQLNKFIENAQI